jgi:hypothetical protein
MDMSTIATWAAVALGAAFVCIGAAGAVAPERASRAYGIPAATPQARAWAAAAAWRDAAAGAAAIAVAVAAPASTTALVVLALALIPLGDMATLARHGVRGIRPHLPHAAGLAAACGIAVVLLAS